MRSLSLELKVGLFAIVVIVILSFMTFKVGGFELFKKKGYTVYVTFRNVMGIDKRTKVKVAGVDAGIIDDIVLEDGKARLRIKMYEGIKLYSDASAYIKTTGLIGDRFLEIRPGSTMPLMSDGGTIARSVDITDIDELIRKTNEVFADIGGLSRSLNEALGSEESKDALKESIINLKEVTRSMNTAIAYNDKRLRKVLDNISELTASLTDVVKTNREPFTTTMSNLKEVTGNLRSDTPSLIRNLNRATDDLRAMVEENRPMLKSTVENLDKISTRIEKGEGTIGKLVNDEKLYDSVNKAVDGVNKTIGAIDRFRTFITFQGEYLSKPKDGKGYFYVSLQPKPDKYYILGIVGDPIGKVTTTDITRNGVLEKEERTEKKIEFTAQFGKRFTQSKVFKDTVLRAGLVENTFGFGADQFLMNDKLKITADAWDFNRDEDGARSPHVKVGADYFVFRNIFVSGGVDNLLNKKRRGAYVGSGIRFEDEDFKYLFGNMPRIPGK